jgi:Protein of unknown function (DUF2442)
MLHKVKAVRGRPDFKIEVLFEQNECALIDLTDFVATGEVTASLRADPDIFVSALRVVDDGEAIGWPGDVEIDADALWYNAHPEDWERDYGALRLQGHAT